MELMHGNQLPSPDEMNSCAKEDAFKDFEENLREENLRLLRSLRLQEMMGKFKNTGIDQFPEK